MVYQVQTVSPYTNRYQNERGAKFETKAEAWAYISKVQNLYPRNHYRVVSV